ncbi:helix-turn-helix domain-containing protein [Psychrobacillus sp. NPDC096426]|uniref:helix-turn-helix domain-containing protein n=1 Tax=Psychrobacillus sp. NPDC096426 TaxID=3364491 RepID=UPI003822292E
MTDTDYFIMRKRKRLKLSQVAEFVDCSISLLSRFENQQVAMDKEKVRKYRDYIEQY